MMVAGKSVKTTPLLSTPPRADHKTLLHHHDDNSEEDGIDEPHRPKEFLPLKPGERRSKAPNKHQERAFGRPDSWLSPSGKVHERVNVKIVREMDLLQHQEMEDEERRIQEEEIRKLQEDQDKIARAMAKNEVKKAKEAEELLKQQQAEEQQEEPNDSQSSLGYLDEKWLHTDNVATRNWNIRKQQPPDSSDLLVVQQTDDISKIKVTTQEPDWLDEEEPGLTAMVRATRRVANNRMRKLWESNIKAAEEAKNNPPPPEPTPQEEPEQLKSSPKATRSKSQVDFYGSLNAIPFLKRNSSPEAALKEKVKKATTPKGTSSRVKNKIAAVSPSQSPNPFDPNRKLTSQEQLWKSMSALDHNAETDRPSDFLPLTPGERKKEKVSPILKSKERGYGRPDDWISPQKDAEERKYRTKKDQPLAVLSLPVLSDDDDEE